MRMLLEDLHCIEYSSDVNHGLSMSFRGPEILTLLNPVAVYMVPKAPMVVNHDGCVKAVNRSV